MRLVFGNVAVAAVQSTIGARNCTDVLGPVGGIKEGILLVSVVGSTDHAMG